MAQYLNYGNQQIDQQELLNNLASQVQGYVARQPWSNKRKEKFMTAYTDLMNRGIQGASNSTGQWVVNVGGDNDIPWDKMDKKDKEMYEEAAYFIQQQMSKLPTQTTEKVEEKKKSDLPTFDNAHFIADLTKSISWGEYGGQPWDVQNQWNEFDKRDTGGKRGRTNRAQKLAQYLKSYSDSLDDTKYNFEDSPFGSLDEFKTRINNAITALNTPDESDDVEALNKIGLRTQDWFNNGLGDPSGKYLEDGTPLSYAQLAEYNKAVEEEKKKQQQQQRDQQKANMFSRINTFGYKMAGKPIRQDRQNDAVGYLNELALKPSLTEDEHSEIVGAFKLAARNNMLQNLSKEELSRFGKGYSDRPDRLKKIQGVEGFYWDSIGQRVIQPIGQNSSVSFQTLVDQNNPQIKSAQKEQEKQNLRNEYAKRTEITAQDWEYLGSIVPDLISIADLEPWTAGAAAATGAGMRHHALASRPGGMSASDKFWQVMDYLGVGLATIPGFGDAYLIGRSFNTIRKVATGLLAVAGAYGMSSSAYNVLKKTANGEDVSLQEKLDLLMAIPQLVSAYRLRSKEGLNEAARAANQENVSVNKGKLKVTVTDDAGNKTVKEIKGLSEEKTNNLVEQFKQAGNDNARKTSIIKGDSEVQARASEQGIDLSKVSVETPSRRLASHRNPTEFEIYQETSPSTVRARFDTELDRLRNSRKWQDRWGALGLHEYDWWYKNTGGPRGETQGNWFRRAWNWMDPKDKLARRIQESEIPAGGSDDKLARRIQEFEIPAGGSDERTVAALQTLIQDNPELRSAFNAPASKLRGETRIPTQKNNKVTHQFIDGTDYTVNYDNAGEVISVTFKNASGTTETKSFTGSLHEQKAALGKWLQEQNSKLSQNLGVTLKADDPKWQALVKSIKDLKRKGYLFKRGGTITNNQIDNFLKQYENKA